MRNKVSLLLIILFAISCKTPEARKPVSVKTGSFIDASVERNKKLNEAETQQILDYIESKPNSNFIASENGFWYQYQTQVDSTKTTPDFGDIVNFKYNLKTLNEQSVYGESKDRDYVMDKQELFSGLREGLKLMKPGESITFLFPSQKAFGYYGDENKIGTSVPLICDVTVNSISKQDK
ncbi:gliding motility-associated peptidyl-prolyl isomerase GldI [Lacinutrix salivirga]